MVFQVLKLCLEKDLQNFGGFPISTKFHFMSSSLPAGAFCVQVKVLSSVCSTELTRNPRD